jgi:hypothetical protein
MRQMIAPRLQPATLMVRAKSIVALSSAIECSTLVFPAVPIDHAAGDCEPRVLLEARNRVARTGRVGLSGEASGGS